MKNMQTREYEFAIQIRDLLFYYLTPVKSPLIPGVPLPFKRISSKKRVIIDGMQLNIRSGCITALLGQNGSGKTSLIKLITGIRSPHRGEVRVFGLPPAQVKHRIGLCLGNSLIYNRLTARENLEYFGKLYSVSNLPRRISQLAELLELGPYLDNVVETYSFGMKAKLAIARSLIHSPDLLILDEPTLGIDLHLAKQIRQFIRGLKCTVLLTTHYMDEAEYLANDLCIIDAGKILALGSKADVLNQLNVTNVPDAFSQVVESQNRMRIAS